MNPLRGLVSVFRLLRRWLSDGIMARVLRNAGLLLTGRVATGVLNLAILSIAARALGAEQFGLIVLVQTYVQTITAVATFQSWQAVIRYGALALEKDDMASFHALLRFCTVLDVAGAAAATAVAVAAVPWIGPLLGWNADVMAAARPYALVTLFAITATPVGLLRLSDRFDLLSIQSVVSPLVRLIGVALAAALGWPLQAYLAVWFVGGAVAGAVLIAMGWIVAARRGQLAGFDASPRAWLGGTQHLPGLWRFALLSNLHVTVQTVTGYLAPVLVGGLAGPAAAGLFKIARDVATAITKPAELLNNSVYPEFARLASQGAWTAFPRLILRGGSMAGAAGLVLIALALLGGPWFLGAFFGAEFVAAQACMLYLCLAATLGIAGFAFDPALYAMGRPGIPLQVNTAALALYVPALALLTPRYGATGAGAAGAIVAAAIFLAMGSFTAAHVRRVLRPAATEPPHARGAAAPGPASSRYSRGRFLHSRRGPDQIRPRERSYPSRPASERPGS
jgi:O-antigen/teichoic acid export membrane protein